MRSGISIKCYQQTIKLQNHMYKLEVALNNPLMVDIPANQDQICYEELCADSNPCGLNMDL